jgi:predicted amidohydrolase YtcJ
VQRGIEALGAERSDDMLRFVGIKFPLDGGVEGGRMSQPYRIVPGEQTNPDYRGVLLLPPGGEDEYVDGLRMVAAAGLQAQTHAVGDETIDVIVRAYGRVNAEKPIRDLRWAIMHIFLPTDEAIRRMAEIGILATAQNHPVLLGHNQRRWWGDERAAYAIPIRRLIDAGILVGGGSDGPVVPFDPFLSMWWMTTRQTLNGYALGPDQAITAREALTLYTINNARIMGVDRDRGSIETGKLADLVVISQDLLAVPANAIRETRALMTVVGGRIVHRDGL